jgi:hypothetical protein
LGGPTGLGSVNTPWIPAFVFQKKPPWVDSPFQNANWISYYVDGLQSSDNQDAYFRYKFNLSSSIDPSTFALTMGFYADNRVWEIYVNGHAQSGELNGQNVLPQFPNESSSNYDGKGFLAGYEVSIALDNNWRQCDNEIIVHVMSTTPYLGFLAQNAVKVDPNVNPCDCHCDCVEVKFPDIKPRICVAWGDSDCDCIETDDVEVLCVTVCNCYSNVTFSNLVICQIQVTDMAGNPVPNLPDGTPSIQVIPSGPICFGDIGPCANQNEPSCVSREIVLWTRGAIGKNYRLVFNGICFDVCHHYQSEQCFIMNLCQD